LQNNWFVQAHQSEQIIARAYWGRSKAEFIAKCGDSLRELEETAYWLELLVEEKIVPAEHSQLSGRNVPS